VAAPAPIDPIGTVHVTVEHLARLEGLARGIGLLPRQARRSVLAGRHASRLRGRGLDFDEIRAYVPGDDIRTLDWKVSMRVGKPQIRAYTEERDRPALFVVDQRMTMFFGSRRAMKSVVAAELAALGVWMAFRAGDRVGAVVFDDAQIRRIRPLRSRTRVHEIFGAIAASNGALAATNAAPPDGGGLDRALRTTAALVPHDYLIVVVSDFAGAGDATLALLRQLATHNDVVAALVFDPLGQALPPGGRVVVTGGALQLELDARHGAVREPLEAAFRGRLHDVAELLRRSGVPMMAIETAGETATQLRHQLGRMGAAPTR
jgi:uncharacterized protein (DUF58 family)